MQLRNVRDRKTPELIIIPMIDIMFFLLVFFMLSTMSVSYTHLTLPTIA